MSDMNNLDVKKTLVKLSFTQIQTQISELLEKPSYNELIDLHKMEVWNSTSYRGK